MINREMRGTDAPMEPCQGEDTRYNFSEVLILEDLPAYIVAETLQ